MAFGETINIIQIGDVALHMHLKSNPNDKVEARGKPEVALNSYRTHIPHEPFAPKPREYRLDAVFYTNFGRTMSHLATQIKGLTGRVTDIIACEVINHSRDTVFEREPIFVPAGAQILYLHNRGRIVEAALEPDNGTYTAKIDLEVQAFWQPLNPAIWFARPRAEAATLTNQKLRFDADFVQPFPLLQHFFSMSRPLSFQKRILQDASFIYDPTYFTELVSRHDANLPKTRFATTWSTNSTTVHDIHVDKARWNAPPLSLYLFKQLTQATSINIDVTHDHDVWQRKTATTTIDLTSVAATMTAAGYTLTDTDILVTGDINGAAYIVRDGAILVYVADTITYDAQWPAMLYPGDNKINIEAPEYAQHHTFRRL